MCYTILIEMTLPSENTHCQFNFEVSNSIIANKRPLSSDDITFNDARILYIDKEPFSSILFGEFYGSLWENSFDDKVCQWWIFIFAISCDRKVINIKSQISESNIILLSSLFKPSRKGFFDSLQSIPFYWFCVINNSSNYWIHSFHLFNKTWLIRLFLILTCGHLLKKAGGVYGVQHFRLWHWILFAFWF